MGKTERPTSEDVREILTNALEVELATLKAAVSFWRQWTELISSYVRTTGANLASIRAANMDVRQVLLEAVDSSRATARLMTELPKKAAEDFLRELDALEKRRAPTKRPAAKRRARAKP